MAIGQRTSYHVPYGRGELKFTLPASFETTVLESKVLPALPDVPQRIQEGLARPVAGRRASAGMREFQPAERAVGAHGPSSVR